MVLNPDIDLYDYVNINNPKSRETVLSMITHCSLVDCFRELNFDLKAYTWRKKNTNKQSRLDFFLISETFLTEVAETKILPGYRIDHSMIYLKMEFGKFKKGHSYWKFNNSLLHDREYVNTIKNLIMQVKLQYAAEIQLYDLPISDIPNENLLLVINDQLFLEVLLMEIRGKTISYASYLKKKLIDLKKNF